jgi:hypothetical protein
VHRRNALMLFVCFCVTSGVLGAMASAAQAVDLRPRVCCRSVDAWYGCLATHCEISNGPCPSNHQNCGGSRPRVMKEPGIIEPNFDPRKYSGA